MTTYNKVELNGTTLMDLSQDTVSDASHIRSGYVGHLNDGTQVTGTYTGGGSVSLQAKTNISPTTSSQTITADSGYDGLSSVQIDAMPSGTAGTPTVQISYDAEEGEAYVTPKVTNTTGYITGGTKSGSQATISVEDLVSGTMSVPYGGTFDVTHYEKISVAIGSATTPATTVTANPSISVNSSGLITATASATQSVTPTVSAGYVSSGIAGTITVSGSNTSQLSTQAAQTIYPSTSDQTITSGKYLTGTQTIKGVLVTNLTAANIVSGVTVKVGDSADDDRIMSVTGTASSGGSSKNVQMYAGPASVKNNGYTASSATLTVSKTGTYNVSWVAWRSSSSSTMGTNLHKGNTSGTNQQTFTGTYGQRISLSNQSYSQGDVLTIYATSGSSSRTIYIANFVIQEV